MLVTLIKTDLHLLKDAQIFLYKILLSGCVDYFVKRTKHTCSSCFVELYKHLRIFENIPEVREVLAHGSCFSGHFSRVLKNSRVLI